jgi:hypothetical protein
VSSRPPNSPSSQKVNTKHVSKRRVRLNKSQQRALEIRASETRWEDPADSVLEPVLTDASGAAAIATPSAGTATRVRRRAVQQGVYLLSRAQELAFIRSDMRRLLLIAGPLLAFMLVLLVIVD